MTVLSALVRLYERMQAAGEAPRPGFSSEKISFAVELDAQGNARLSDRRSFAGKKPAPVMMNVPKGPKRSSGIRANLFWDKSSYVLGVTAVEEEDASGDMQIVAGQGRRTADEHSAFVEAHRDLLAESDDPGLQALWRFLETWTPERFAAEGWPVEALDQNLVFAFEDGSGAGYVHDRSVVLSLLGADKGHETGLCLVTGEEAPIARLHPSIKGVMGAQSSGASLVSFNDDAYESFGKSQGDNAPVSDYAAFAYGAALNALLERKGPKELERHLRIGDTTVVFWVDTPEAEAAGQIEVLMGTAINPPDEAAERARLQAALADVAAGRPADPKLDPETTVYVLGLAPNAARLSVRFWHQGRFGDFARNMVDFWDDLRIEGHPDHPPWKGPPALWSLLYEIAIRVGGKAKADTIPPLLGGEVMRAVLLGRPLPRSLLSAVIGRVRADGDACGRRAAICKAVVNRALRGARNRHDETLFDKEMIPVGLDTENTNPAYRLGRLFAVLERAQSAALPGLNATIKDRYFAAASATPARVFPLLIKNATHHLALLKKGENGGLGHWLEKEMGVIWIGLDADMPRAFNLEDQGRFIAGYYHQRWTPKTDDTDEAPVIEETDQ